MATYGKLEVVDREAVGSRKVKALRKEGLIPAVYYYKDEDNINLLIDRKDLHTAMTSGFHIFETKLKGKPHFVMIKDVQYHPVTDDIIHLDLLRVRRDQKMTISVPVVIEGDSIGVRQGGILIHGTNMLEVSCLPADVPEQVLIDISDLELNNSITAEDIEVGENIDVVSTPDTVLASVVVPKAVEEEEVVEEDEELEVEAEGEEPSEETEEEAPSES